MNKADIKLLKNIEKSCILKAQCFDNTFNELIDVMMKTKGVHVALLDGNQMSDKEKLFGEFAQQLRFPAYFGWNWDAFDECINDLSWIDADSIVIAITSGDHVLMLDQEDQRIFGELMIEACAAWLDPEAAGEKWGHSAMPFHIIIQYRDEISLQKFGKPFATAPELKNGFFN